MSLRELAGGYREAAARLRVAVADAQDALKGLDGVALREAQERLQDVREALKQARDLWELCGRYYEPGFHPSPTYTVSELRAGHRDSLA